MARGRLQAVIAAREFEHELGQPEALRAFAPHNLASRKPCEVARSPVLEHALPTE